jgi:hypothetical protein
LPFRLNLNTFFLLKRYNNIPPAGVFIEIKNMKPMGSNSTPFISYHNITVKDVDLLEDAWGFNSEFGDVINLLGKINPVPRKRLTLRLVEKIRKQH